MKKLITIVLILFSCIICKGQAGNLVPDSSQARIDTISMKGIMYWDFTNKVVSTKTDSGYVVSRTCPMVFISQDNKTVAATSQRTTLWEKWFILPKRTQVQAENIIFYKTK